MQIILYHNYSDADHINKQLSEGVEVSGVLRTESTVIKPIIRMEMQSDITYNYCYIPEWHRFYYIDEINSYRSNIIDLSLRVDPLMSFAQDILNLEVIINKQDSEYTNLYLDDGDWVMENRMFNTIYPFSGGFNDVGEFVLIVAGA